MKNFILGVAVSCVLMLPGVAGAAESSFSELMPLADNAAAIVTCNGPDCTFCSLMQMIDKIIDWLVGFAMIIATISIAIAGYRLVYSQGNAGAVTKTKELFTNIIIGIILIMTAWLLIDTVMKLLVGEEFGPWNEIEDCGGMFGAGKPEDQSVNSIEHPNTLDLESDGGMDVVVSNQYGPGGLYGLEGGEKAPVASNADSSYTFDGGIQAQMSHASAALRNTLNCMSKRIPANVGRISSISDSNIVSGSKTFAQCVKGGCNHVSGSRHYGGTSYTGSSYAVDFGDEENIGTLCPAANACGNVKSCSVHNGNHVHMELKYPNGT